MIALIKACFIITTFLCYSSTYATMTFSSKNAALFLQNNNSKFRATPTSILGWKNRSLVKNVTGGGWGDYNIKQYDRNSNSIITYAESPADLVYNNSNALGVFPTPIRTHSNAVARGIRNISNTIIAGFSRSPIRYDSNAINYVSPVVRTNSNAFARGTRNNSQSMVCLSRTNNNAAQAITYVKQTHTVLTNRQTVGLMRFNNGFTILPGQYAILDTSLSVSGGFDLRDTGSLTLRSNLRLDGNTTLTNGGRIYGKNTGIILDGNLTLAANKVLHLDGSTFIDGNEHTLYVGDNAQIFVDTDATVTLRNLVVRNGQHTQTFPPIRLASHSNKLCLDNTTLAPGNDFLFPQGQFFVHNDVQFTGTSAFIYTSPIPSWITSNSRLYFDIRTTFSIAPATFTDAPYTLKNTYTDCNFIKMTDKSSQLYLNGCNVAATDTGLRLTKGTVLCDNALSFDSNTTSSIQRFSSTTYSSASYGNIIYYNDISWSPDGHFIAVGGSTTQTVKIFQLTGSGFANSGNPIATSTSYGGNINSVSWSPDSRFIAVGGESPQTVKIFQFTESGFANGGNPIATSANYGGTIISAFWSPDGRFIAVGGVTTQTVKIFQFTGSSFTNSGNPIATSANYGGNIRSTPWSPDGRFIAAGGTTTQTVKIFQFTGSGFTNSGNPIATSANYGGVIYKTFWNPDGTSIVAGGATTYTAKIHPLMFAKPIAPQALSKSILFGDSTKGADYDADVTLLGGARIEVQGKVNYDCVN